jgi:hypothetical protein
MINLGHYDKSSQGMHGYLRAPLEDQYMKIIYPNREIVEREKLEGTCR